VNRGPTHWSFVEVDGAAPGAGPIGGSHTCRDCREPATVLHADRYLRERVGWGAAAEPKAERHGR
jgi:hypothetical protein